MTRVLTFSAYAEAHNLVNRANRLALELKSSIGATDKSIAAAQAAVHAAEAARLAIGQAYSNRTGYYAKERGK